MVQLPPPREPIHTVWAKRWEVIPDFATIPPRRWLYGRHYIREHVTVTVAPGGLGKSALCLAECVAMATGRPILGVPPSEPPIKVWYWNGEDPLEETIKRTAAICIHYGIDQEQLAQNLYIGSGVEQGLIVARQDNQRVVINEPHIDALRQLFTTEKIDLAVIDPFVSSHEVTENDNMAINAVARAWKALAGEAGAAIELVHHVRKGNGMETTIEDARGAVALIGAARSARVLNVMTKDQAASVAVLNPRSHFNVSIGKANLAPPPDKADWYRFESVELGNGDSIGVVTSWDWPDMASGVTAEDLHKVQTALQHGAWKASEQAKGEWFGRLIADTLDIDTSDPKGLAKVRKLIKDWVASDALRIEKRTNDKGRVQPFIVVGKPVDLSVQTFS